MKMPTDEIVVLDIAGSVAKLYAATYLFDPALIEIGFSRTGDKLTRSISNDVDRQSIVHSLIGIGALFSSGRDWSPEELVNYLKDKGQIDGNFRVISWTGPDNYFVSSQ